MLKKSVNLFVIWQHWFAFSIWASLIERDCMQCTRSCVILLGPIKHLPYWILNERIHKDLVTATGCTASETGSEDWLKFLQYAGQLVLESRNRRSSASVYYTERKLRRTNKKQGRTGGKEATLDARNWTVVAALDRARWKLSSEI